MSELNEKNNQAKALGISEEGEAMTGAHELLRLKESHKEEIERLSLFYAERLRQVEANRLELEEECESLQGQLAEVRERLRSVEQCDSAQQAEVEATVAFLKSRIEALEVERQELSDQGRDLSKALGGLEAEIREKEKVLAEVERKLSEAVSVNREREKALDEALGGQDELRRQVQAANALISQLTAELEKERQKVHRQGKTLSASVHTITALELQLADTRVRRMEAERSSCRLEAEILRLSKELTEAKYALSDTTKTIDALKASLQVSETQVRELRDGALAVSRENSRLKGDIVDQLQKIAKLEEDLDSLRSTHAECQLDIERIRKRLFEQSDRHAAGIAEYSQKIADLQKKLSTVQESYRRADRQHRLVCNSTSYKLGSVLIRSVMSWNGFLSLPLSLWRVFRYSSRKDKEIVEIENDLSSLESELKEIYDGGGLSLAENWLREVVAFGGAFQQASALVMLAKLAQRDAPYEAVRLAREALKLDPRPFRRKWVAFLLHDAGAIVEPYELLKSIPDEKFKPEEKVRFNRIAGDYRLLTGTPFTSDKTGQEYRAVDGRVLYVAASSLPHNISGYTVRTHSILRALRAEGWDVSCVTRPGYPQDRRDVSSGGPGSLVEIDGVRYETIPGPDRRKIPMDEYVDIAADLIEKHARNLGPAVIHAASNHENALPALIAARRLGIPFIYEVRGLWEHSRASRQPGWEKSEAFALSSQLEAYVAKNADSVLAITQGVADELIERGVNPDKIALVPNGVDLEGDRDIPLPIESNVRTSLGLNSSDFTIGYVGSLVSYEGVDDLITAFSVVSESVGNAKLVIVGDGEVLPSLRSLADRLNLNDRILFCGRVLPEEARKIYAALDVVVNPRKADKVCQIVSPLKPLEAMRYGVPLIVSDAKALREMVRDGVNALVHEAGNPESLAACLMRMARDASLRERLSTQALKDVEERSWGRIVKRIDDTYVRLGIEKTIALSDVEGDGVVSPVSPLDVPSTRNSLTEDEKREFEARLQIALDQSGVPGVDALISSQSDGHSARFRAFCEIKGAQILLAKGYVDRALQHAEAALARDSSPGTLRGCLRILSDAARLDMAYEVAQRLEGSVPAVSESDHRMIGEVRARWRLMQWARTKPVAREIKPVLGRVLNVLAFSLPHSSVGYATRSHGLALGIKANGWDVVPYTRPGFPWDSQMDSSGLDIPSPDEIDGIRYHRLSEPNRKRLSEVDYLCAAIDEWEKVIELERPELVHAASNYVTALPALIASRRKGIPFVYEIRGFWEVTRSSRDPGFVNTPKYRYMELFERIVAMSADHVITITTPMKEELLAWGIPPERISIAYNSVDPERFVPKARSRVISARLGIPDGVPVIGYVGSFVDYEGLDDLVDAAALLRESNVEFRMLLVGDGAEFENLKRKVSEYELEDLVILTGRVPHHEVEDYYSLIDIAPFPRKPWKVCELVSPLKPLEAMASEKAVIVSKTRALEEIVSDGVTGLLSQGADVMTQ